MERVTTDAVLLQCSCNAASSFFFLSVALRTSPSSSFYRLKRGLSHRHAGIDFFFF